ncbi:hypothetical protein Tco_0153730 [Tanacetum coccineum]
MSKNTQEALTIIENKAKVRTCRNKPQISSSSGSSTQIDAITALTKQVEVLGNYIASMQETNNRNQEASSQLMQNQMGQIVEAFQERPSCVLPSDTETYPREEHKAVTTMDGLTLDGSFIPHSLVHQEEEQEPETIMDVVEIASSHSTQLFPPPKTPPFIDIVDSLSNKVPIQNDKNSGSPTLFPDPVIESLSPSLTPFGDIDLLFEEIDAFLVLDSIPPYIDDGIYDSEGDILFLEGLLNDEILRDLPPLDLNNDPKGDIIFLENLLKDEPLEVEESEIYPLKWEPSNTILMGDEEIKVDHFKEIDDPVPNPKNEHRDELETETIMDEVHSTVQIPPLFEELTSDKSMQDIILHRIHHGMVNSYRLSFYLDLLFPEDNFGSLSSDSFELGDQNVDFDTGILLNNGIFSFSIKSPHLLSDNFLIDKCHILREISLMIESSVSFHPKDKEIQGDLDPFIEIPSGESKVHSEVLSVLWGNRLSIPDGSLSLSSRLKGGGNNNNKKNNKSETDKSLLDHGRLAYQCGGFQKGEGSPGRNKTPGP